MGTEFSSVRSCLSNDASRDEDERVSLVLDALPLEVIHVDRGARIRYVNRAAARTLARIQAFLPVPAAEILGQPIDVLNRVPEVADLTLSPMVDDGGTFIGTVLTISREGQRVSAEALQHHAGHVVTSVKKLQETAATMTRQAAVAARACQGGVDISEESRRIVGQLRESSAQIGHLVALVASIARQTRLLALTVGIEAARAGENCPGFGVIANDVKTLAKETAKASSEIQDRAASIHENSGAASEALLHVDGILRELNAYQDEISTAVRAQSAVAARIASEVTEVVRAAGELAERRAPEAWPPEEEGVVDIRNALSRRAQRAEA